MIINNQEDVTPAVLAEIARAPDPRFREVMSAFVRHLHAFAREVRLTEEEFQKAVGYIVACGQRLLVPPYRRQRVCPVIVGRGEFGP